MPHATARRRPSGAVLRKGVAWRGVGNDSDIRTWSPPSSPFLRSATTDTFNHLVNILLSILSVDCKSNLSLQWTCSQIVRKTQISQVSLVEFQVRKTSPLHFLSQSFKSILRTGSTKSRCQPVNSLQKHISALVWLAEEGCLTGNCCLFVLTLTLQRVTEG